jgi:succinate dehydrogenase / fumarate reductase flavoprotein subunit
MREVKAGRGSPHGGVFLDISWIREHLPDAAEHIKRKLPSMYHQFKQLADIDITAVPMEVGPTTHYIMGGIRVDGDTQMSSVPGLFASGECASGINGANRLGGNSLSDIVVFGKLAGEHAANFAKKHKRPAIDGAAVDAARKAAVEPFERPAGENPYSIQSELQERMQDLVGIVRTEPEMKQALVVIEKLKDRARTASVAGSRDYNPGWHTAIDLKNMLIVSEAIAKSAIERKESRGGHFREDFAEKSEAWNHLNMVVHKGPGGAMALRQVPRAEMPEDLKQIIQELK